MQNFISLAARTRNAHQSNRSRKSRGRRLKLLALAVSGAPALLALSSQACGQTSLYWDTNGITNGSSGGTTAAGNWSATDANWSTDSTGATATSTWVAGSTAVFSAGSNATGGYTVTLNDTESISGLLEEEGTVTIKGPGSLDFGSNAFSITTNKSGNNAFNIQVPILGSGDMTIANTTGADATINLDGQMSGFTGNIIVGAGSDPTKLTKLQMDWAPGDATKTITLNSFSELGNNNQLTLADGTLTPLSFTIANPINLVGSDAWLACAGGTSSTEKIVTYSGNITGSGNLWLGINRGGGNGAVVLSGNNSYTGDTYVVMSHGNGMVQLASDGALPTSTHLIFGPQDGGTGAVGPLDLNGHSITTAGLESRTTNSDVNIVNSSATPVTITLNQDNSTTFNGVIGSTNTAAISPFSNRSPFQGVTTLNANISLVKNGAGSLALTAASPMTGSTTINGGTISLGKHFGTIGSPGAAANTVGGDVTVNSGGTLETTVATTTGTNAGYYAGLGGRLVVNGGSVSPGGGSAGTAGVGGLAVTGMTVNGGSTLAFDLTDSTTYDSIADAGDLTLDSGTHTISLLNPPVAGRYTLLSYDALNWNGTNGFTLPSDPHFTWNFTGDATTAGALSLIVTDPNTHLFVWDVGQGSGAAPIVNGSGTWVSDPTGTNPDSHNWRDIGPNTNATYDNSNTYDVIIGNNANANGGTITLGGDITVGGNLTFGPIATPYTIEGNGHSLTTSAAGIEADSSATINAPVNFSADQTWTVGVAKTLTIGGSVHAGAGNTLTKSGAGTLVVNGSGGSIGAVTLNAGTLETNDPSFIGPAIINVGDGTTLKLDTSVDLAGGIFANDRSTNGQNFTWDFGANNVSISGGVALKGNVTKLGTGDLTLNGNNTSFAGGTGIGILIINDPSTVHLSGFNPLGTSPNWENLGYNSPFTLDVPIDQIIGCIRDGSGTVTKTGGGKLTVSGTSSATTGTNPAIDIAAGSVQMDSVGGLGGGNQNAAPQMAITLEPGTELITNYGGGSRNSADVIFKNNTRLTMADTSPLSTDTEFSAYGSGSTNYNSSIQVNGDVTFSNQAQADTATFTSRNLQLLMPVVVNSGATLTLSAANSAGNYDKAALTFRGVDNVTNHPGDRLEIKGGGTVDATSTVGEIYFGATGRGKPIVADGGGTALFKAGTHSFFRDQGSASDSATGSAMTKLVIAEGTNLRFEAPMNAVYNPTPEDPNNPGHAPAIRDYEGTTGLLGTNNTPSFNGSGLPSGYNNIGNGYTILSPNRATNLSLNYQPNGLPAPVVPSGTLTLAATDAGGATGTVNAGPASPSAVALALDNTPTSGNLVYQIDPAANGATFQNFSKLIVTRSNTSASVTAKLLGPARIPALDVTGGAQLDIDNHALAIDYGSGNPSPIGTWDGSKYTGVTGLVQSGRNNGTWNGPGIITSQAQAQTKLTGIGVAEASEVLGLSGTATATWNGQTVDAGTVLVKYTYGGDANLDGKINIDDYGLIDSHVGQSGTAFGWHNGDFNYDGKINIDDYGIIDGNIGAQGDPFPNSALALSSASALGSVSALGGVSAVPEPTSLALIGLGAAGFLRRRRRQN